MSRRRIALAAFLSVFVVGVLMFARFDRSSSRHSRPAVTSSEGTPHVESGSARQAAVPSGFSHDAVGAKAAAVAYAQYPAVVVGLSVDQAADAQAVVSSDAARDGLVTQTRTELAQLYAAAPPETLSYRVGVLAVSVSMSGADSARTSVWQVGVLTAPAGSIYAEWATVTQELVWEHDDWRIAGEHAEPGPTPTLDPRASPTAPTDLATQLVGLAAPEMDRR
jgi:hypothetical protein